MDSSPELELTPQELILVQLVEKQPAPERHSARTAIHHLKKAWRIKDIDREMAYFRSLMAEEEAASAVFRSLKRLNYQGADQLNHRNHVHKNALVPFVLAVGKVIHFLNEQGGYNPHLVIDEAGPNAGKLRVRFTIKLPNGDIQHAWPMPPLHLGISLNDQMHMFQQELQELASEGNAQDAWSYVKRMANRRNLVLYAHKNGIPVAETPVDDFLCKRRQNVFMLLTIYLLIDQYDEHQKLVQQGIGVLLKLLKLVVAKPDIDGDSAV